MRARSLCLALLVAACGTRPPPASPAKPAPPPAPRAAEVDEPEPEPEPEPLATEKVAFEQGWEFVSPQLGSVRAHLVPEDELVKRLPASVRAQYQAVERARANLRKHLENPKATTAATKRARTALRRAHDGATRALERSFARKPTGETGIALARLRVRGTHTWPDSPLLGVRYGGIEIDRESELAVKPLREASKVTGLDPLGRWVRLELVHHLMATERASEARPILDELMPASPPDQRPLLWFRIGLSQGLEGRDEAAAESFRRAHEDLAVSSRISRFQLLAAETVARYRAQQFDRVLGLAKEATEERLSPTPLLPDPSPPPPPPSPPARKSSAKNPKTGRSAGMLGVLGTTGFGLTSVLETIGEREILQLATDAVERLGLDPSAVDGPPELRAALLSRLAVRALHRNDREAAAAHATAARELGGSSSREGLRVLAALALRDGSRDQADELLREASRLRYAPGMYGTGLETRALDAELRRKHARARNDDDDRDDRDVERNVRSLLRLCLEPVHHRLSATEKRDRRFVAEIELRAKVFSDGRVELQSEAAPSSGDSAAVSEALACAKRMAPRVLARAPASIQARVSVRPLRPPGGLFGSAFGDSGLGLGSGGLGIGTGGAGFGASGATGLGGLGATGLRGGGTLGGSGGGGRVGGGLGGLGGRTKPPPAKKQTPQKKP